MCQAAASKFTCSPDEDRKLLADPNLSFNKRNIITCRLEEKNTLAFFMQFSRAVTSLLNMPIDKAKAMVE
jgi:hypothetical protein